MPDDRYDYIDIDKIEFDIENPRIIKELETVPEEEKQEKAGIYLLLARNKQPGPDNNELTKSIRESGGVLEAIQIVPLDENETKYKVVEGNTRLAVYKNHLRDLEPDNKKWKKIKSCIFYDKTPKELDEMRLVAHIMGKKQWTLYAQGAYIDKLINSGRNYEQVANILGGNSSDVRRKRTAYTDFKEYYSPLFTGPDQGQENERHMSFFDEACKGGVELAFASEFGSAEEGKKRLAQWVKDKRITFSNHVRDIPKVFANEEVKNRFLEGEIKNFRDAINQVTAADIIEAPADLENTTIEALADELNRRINNLSENEINNLQNDTAHLELDSLRLLFLDLEKLLEEVDYSD